jgi:glucuronate isomerase
LENFLIQTAYTQLYFPVRIIWGSRKLSPSIGFQYEIKRSTDKFQMLAENNSYRDYKNTMHQFGPEIGLNYMLNKKIFLNLYYYIGILNNPQRLKSENELLFNTNNNLKPMTLSFVLSINLNHKNIQKDGIPAIE